ncbi:visual pigment-like receptor peropsin isoform X2 [Mytilus galloprovincialis]|uniref:visual pigment-like receptor peropsin isoform X2 n=1 Tax=Mytilus galloprovincialis TaxID=29158 RepID=UPI003F7C6B6B
MTNNETNTPALLLSPLILTSLGVYLTIAIVIGTLANGSALYVFFTNKQLRSPTNMFIISLLICDFLMCTVGAPLPAASNFAHRWLWGWSGCVFHGFTVYILGLTNLYILTAISVDRYIIIAKPLQASKINHRVVGISVFLCYFFGFVWSFLPLVGWSEYVFEGAGTACGISYDYNSASAFSYNIAIFINCYWIPIFIMIYCYYYVFMTIRSMARNTAFDRKSRIAKRNLRIEKKMAKTIALMIGVFMFAWTPYAVAAFWVAFGFGELPVIVSTSASMFAKSASVWNPLIYVYTNKQFRKAFYEKIPCSGFRSKLIKKEEEKEAESEESDIDDKSKTTGQKVTHLKVQHMRRGVTPINDDDDAGEITICEDIVADAITLDDDGKKEEIEIKDLCGSCQA